MLMLFQVYLDNLVFSYIIYLNSNSAMIGSTCYLVLGALLSMLSLSAAWDFEPMSVMELLTAGREDSGDGPR